MRLTTPKRKILGLLTAEGSGREPRLRRLHLEPPDERRLVLSLERHYRKDAEPSPAAGEEFLPGLIICG